MLGTNEVGYKSAPKSMQETLAGVALLHFWEESEKFSYQTFGSREERGPVGPLRHLAKEVEETIEAVCASPTPTAESKEEFADCVLLICDAARRHGLDVWDLLDASLKKLNVNQSREWQKPLPGDADKPIEHVR